MRIGELPAEHVELDPAAPRPPFPLWMRLPAEWSLLDTNPATWQRSAEELVRTSFGGGKLPAAERRGVLSVLEDLVADCQRAGSALNLVTVGRLKAGTAFSAGIHVAFAGDERPATLGRVQDVLSRSGTTTEIGTASGPALLHRDRSTMVVPGTATIAALTNLQIFLPFAGTTWTAVLSTSSAFDELTPRLEALVREMAAGIRRTATDADGSDGVAVDGVEPAGDGSGEAGSDLAGAVPDAGGPGEPMVERAIGAPVAERPGAAS
ncbi:hypothetical protein GIS00_15050 [Nakamurella sp. YIM 132087]|uniref:Uncharacterized protein n=1 Tax=Nakamurella alba TaxID=2665158 RepID=A0A7K1FMB5_9ACTN|nr:hypothetical protein [Nakamurella alba]MTD15258.1 hypothetical protein [Nakamurella alba]